jgi:DNA-binding beta-propeller fold protein YncE
LEATIPLNDISGRIDHIAVEPRRNRPIVSELGNHTVDVVDLATRTVFRRIHGLQEPQGVAYSEKADMIIVANAGDGSVRFYRGQTLEPVGSLSLGDDADNIRIDPRNGLIVVGYGNGALAIIDPVSQMTVGDIKLSAHPEGLQIAATTGLVFVNVPEAHQIAVADLNTRQLVATWRMQGRANFPMALDHRGDLLATVFRNPPQIALIDTRTGRTAGSQAACGDADDVFFDERRQRIYISCGSGEVATLVREGTEYRSLTPTKTARGARTALFVAELDRLFVAKPAGFLGGDTALLIYRPLP